jgi:endogenous inhibitor of DNA gyrase (YacG/DUF329 family)
MAECPNCKLELQWDFCNDTYRSKDEGKWAEETQIIGIREVMPDDKPTPISMGDLEVVMQQCPECKKVLGFSVLQDNVEGSDQFSCEEWGGIHWDSRPHSYSDC